MEQIYAIQHDLKKDVHNLFNLLRFLKEENGIQDEELKMMLEKNLEREKKINESIDQISQTIKSIL